MPRIAKGRFKGYRDLRFVRCPTRWKHQAANECDGCRYLLYYPSRLSVCISRPPNTPCTSLDALIHDIAVAQTDENRGMGGPVEVATDQQCTT